MSLKSLSIGIFLFIILIVIIINYRFIPNKLKLLSFVNIFQNRFVSAETEATALSKQTLFSASDGIRCIVYTKSREGRLGNRLFMVASAYGLARLHSCHLYITEEVLNDIKAFFLSDLSPILLSSATFNLTVNNKSTPMTRVSKFAVCQYFLELTRPNAIPEGQIFELTGYWQSYLHFSKYANELRQQIFVAKPFILSTISRFFVDIYQRTFHFKPQFSLHNHGIFKQQLAHSSPATWIGIHVRRADSIIVDIQSSDNYLLTAIWYFTERYSNAHFVIASDDRPYCQNLFRNRSNIFITPDSFSPGDDLTTLSLCEHTIVTCGSFGWWAAFLANGEVIHDVVYPSGCEKREEYYPPWFLIDGYVRPNYGRNYTV